MKTIGDFYYPPYSSWITHSHAVPRCMVKWFVFIFFRCRFWRGTLHFYDFVTLGILFIIYECKIRFNCVIASFKATSVCFRSYNNTRILKGNSSIPWQKDCLIIRSRIRISTCVGFRKSCNKYILGSNWRSLGSVVKGDRYKFLGEPQLKLKFEERDWQICNTNLFCARFVLYL